MSRYIDADELIVIGLDDPDCEHQFKFVPWEFIEDAPTVDVPQWIPCRERMPECDGLYLVTVRNQWGRSETEICCFDEGDKERPFCPTGKGASTYYLKTGYPAKMTVAWMPLSEPWKGE